MCADNEDGAETPKQSVEDRPDAEIGGSENDAEIGAPEAKDGNEADIGEVPPPPPPASGSTLRKRCRSRFHLSDHFETNPHCPGCQAKARDKRHRKRRV